MLKAHRLHLFAKFSINEHMGAVVLVLQDSSRWNIIGLGIIIIIM